jgi:hypothetical protein
MKIGVSLEGVNFLVAERLLVSKEELYLLCGVCCFYNTDIFLFVCVFEDDNVTKGTQKAVKLKHPWFPKCVP